jgi:hypothetical protein
MPCGCHDLIQLFAERIYDWHGLRANRPNVMQVNTRCQSCGREWCLVFQAIPQGHPLFKAPPTPKT